MADTPKSVSLALGALPPPPPAPATELIKARSVVLRSAPQPGNKGPTELRWMSRGLMGLRSASMLEAQHEAQHTKAGYDGDPPAGRVSTEEVDDYRRRSGHLGGLADYVDPPFDLRRLGDLLYHSDTYFAVVDQMALDVASDWFLADARESSPGSGSIRGDIAMDDAAKAESEAAEKYLNGLCRGFDDEPVGLIDWSNRLLLDKGSMGNSYAEVVSDPNGVVTRLIHIPGYLILRHAGGGRYVMITEAGNAVAYFRRFGSPLASPADAPDYYVSNAEATVRQPAGMPKPELLDFHRYHPAERYYGVPPIVSAFNAVAGNIFASNRNVRFFVNRAMPDYVVMIKCDKGAMERPEVQKALDDAQAMIESHMKNMLEGEDHRTLVMQLPTGEVEIVFERVGDLPREQEWGGYQKDNRDAILRVYRMRPEEIGIIETAHLGSGTGESQAERYKRAQIEPQQRQLEGFFNLILDRAGFHRVRFRFTELDILDEQSEIQMCATADSTGALSINDVRAWLSRVVKDQDFPPEEHEYASVPKALLELILAGTLQPGQLPPVQTVAAGYPRTRLAALLGRNVGRPNAAEDLAQLRARRGAVAAEAQAAGQSTLDRARARLGLPAPGATGANGGGL